MRCAFVLSCIGLLLADCSGSSAPLPEEKLTAAQLVEVFLTNEAYADEHYVGKEIELTGKVVSVTRSKYGPLPQRVATEYILKLDLGEAGKGRTTDIELLIFFDDKDRARLAKLKPGETVVVRGQCKEPRVWAAEPGKGGRHHSKVHLRDCTLVEGK